ncbi:oligosaccharide flippase family protein [Halorhabdus rudnickae]|uniref:oligosaccharide flippase family protein n=1 Tax=Halorhabdus rudnickae TaxID=1775544 RepID=UPI00108282E2|nr:oligosaccharide flippase family protein [Halorhabdus rudnickae]
MAGPEQETDSDQFINIRNQASLSLAGNLVDTAISFLGLILFANVLGAGGLGKFYVVLAIVKVALFPIAGIGQSVMKRGSERNLDSAAFLGGGLTMGLAYASIVGFFLTVAFLTVPELLQYSFAVITSAFTVFLSRIFYMLLLDTYRSHGKTGFATLTDNAHGVIETGAQVALLLAGFQVAGLLVGTAMTTIGVSIVLFFFTDITISRPAADTLRSIVEFARWSVLTSGLGTVYDRLPVLVLGVILGNAAAGYYTSAMRLLMLGSYVGGSIAPALMVRVSATEESSEATQLDSLQMSLNYAAVLSIPMMFGSFAIPDALMETVFGPTFSTAGPILMGLSIYHIINTFSTVTYSFFDGIGRPAYATKATALSLVVRIAMLPLLVWFGVLGVVGSVVVSHAFHLAVAQRFMRLEFGQVIVPNQVVWQFMSGLIILAIVVGLSIVLPIVNWLTLLTVVAVGAVSYVSLLGLFDGYLRGMIRQLLRETISTSL